mmetsp:Transcript_40404/g.129717  ORF Transcript_40404/g.129717 Transcript_40404/m.129717 type:complete len:211 (-) Transcript_40404:90-722(-)
MASCPTHRAAPSGCSTSSCAATRCPCSDSAPWRHWLVPRCSRWARRSLGMPGAPSRCKWAPTGFSSVTPRRPRRRCRRSDSSSETGFGGRHRCHSCSHGASRRRRMQTVAATRLRMGGADVPNVGTTCTTSGDVVVPGAVHRGCLGTPMPRSDRGLGVRATRSRQKYMAFLWRRQWHLRFTTPRRIHKNTARPDPFATRSQPRDTDVWTL